MPDCVSYNIDEEKCSGLCAEACHKGAIEMVDGKAKLVHENFCEGFGDCLPNCPTGAITFEEREAPEYDETAVKKAKAKKNMTELKHEHHEGGCPGSRMMQFEQKAENALRASGKFILWQVVTISREGEILAYLKDREIHPETYKAKSGW